MLTIQFESLLKKTVRIKAKNYERIPAAAMISLYTHQILLLQILHRTKTKNPFLLQASSIHIHLKIISYMLIQGFVGSTVINCSLSFNLIS